MARLALGIAGAVIGSFIPGVGPALGFELGSIAGALLFPPKLPTQYGPRLNDKQISTSTDGEPIPWGYGGFRIGGNIIWADQIKEITTKQSQSAKGGPSQTTISYTYTCSFAVAFCEGPASILRIWADSKLIYDSTGKTAVTLDTGIKSSGGVSKTVRFTPALYNGTETQLPDPTIESFLGVGSTPGYRGIVYAVFTDFPLADFGNRIPTIRAEISTGSTLTYVKDAYPANNQQDFIGAGSPPAAVNPFATALVDPINRIGYFLSSQGQAIMAVDLNVDSSQPLNRWAANTQYRPGDQVLDSNGNVQYVQSFSGSGTSAATEPTWATVDGTTTTDHPGGNQIVWMKIGVGPNAVVILRKGTLDPTTVSPYFLTVPKTFGSSQPQLNCIDTTGHIWGIANLTKPATPSNISSTFAVRYDPITFKAVGVFDVNVFNTVPPGILSMTPTKVASQDLVYIVVSSTTGAGNQLHIVNARSMSLSATGMLYLTSLFGGTGYFSQGNTLPQPAIDPNTGKFYFIVVDNLNPSGISNWELVVIDPRDGYTNVNIPSWGKLAGQWKTNKIVASFSTPSPPTSLDGYPSYCLFDDTDGSVLCLSAGNTATIQSIKKIDTKSGAILAFSPANSHSPDSNILTYVPAAYRGLCPNNGLLKLLSFNGKFINYISCSTLQITQSVALNNWEPALGSSNDVFTGFSYDEASDSALVTPSTFSPTPLRIFFDRQAVQSESLDQIVSDLLQRSGVDPSNIDVTAIAGINCLGYCVTRTADAKACLQPLTTAFFFDLVETGFKIKAVPRGQAPSQNIPEIDLGLIDDQFKLAETIGQEQDLPKTVSVEYVDPALNYQQGKQHRYRSSRVKKAKNHDVLTLPITLHADDAAQIADKYLLTMWAERNQYEFKLTGAKYLLIDPTDVVQFMYNGLPFQARIVKTSLGQNKVLELSGVSEDARQYLSTLAGAGDQGFNDQTLHPKGATLLFLLDTPLLQDIDNVNGVTGMYYQMTSPTPDIWPGAVLYQSADGSTFVNLQTDLDAATYGVVNAPTPAPLFSNGVYHPFSWDLVTTINVRLASGTLSSTDELSVLNGANSFFLGGEVMQFQNATLNSDGSYTLSKLLRGRRGTEGFTEFHAVGETFLLLDSTTTKRVQLPTGILNLLRYYQAVTIGSVQAGSTSTPFALQGNDLKPYAPAQFTGSVDAGSNLNMSWVRRTRVGGAWVDGTGEVALSEQQESYDVDIMVFNRGGKKLPSYVISGRQAGIVYTGAAVNPYDVVIPPFTIVWEDGVSASYAFGTVGEGLRFTILAAPSDAPVATYGTSIWVHDPNRAGSNNLSDFGFDNTLLPDDMHANSDGYFNLLFIPGTIGFPVGTSANTVFLAAKTGDCSMRTFAGLSNPTVSYTDAQQQNDFGRNEFSNIHGPGFVRVRVFQNSASVGRGFRTENPTTGRGNVVSGGSDATSILGVPITGTPIDGDILQYNATANEWQIVGPLLKRQSISFTSAGLLSGQSAAGNFNPGCKSFILLSVTVDRSARVQLYPTSAAQVADAGRAANTPPDPLTQNEILADHLLVAGGAETFICSTPLICSNMDGTPIQKIYYQVTNNSGAASAVTVTLEIIPLEV